MAGVVGTGVVVVVVAVVVVVVVVVAAVGAGFTSGSVMRLTLYSSLFCDFCRFRG